MEVKSHERVKEGLSMHEHELQNEEQAAYSEKDFICDMQKKLQKQKQKRRRRDYDEDYGAKED